MAEVILTTLNARYHHASLGLRYLLVNLGELKDRAQILEFTVKSPVAEVVSRILQRKPRIVGFGIYIWNTRQTLEVIKELKRQAPQILVVLGGPEISYETESQELFAVADFVFQGEADFTFRDFIRDFSARGDLPPTKIIPSSLPKIDQIVLPYGEYTDEDIQLRTLYVEASRGCPYKCEYCLSSLDVSVRNFPLDNFLAEMEKLLQRGARQFKFVDRTFNLAPATSTRILQFFLERIHLGLFLHFEMVPDRLPEELKALIEKFPAGSLQFEIGIQTWSPEVSRHVSRRQNFPKIQENFKYLRERTGVHTHADLIVGLPGETWDSFRAGFNALFSLDPDEIQVGLLKRLKGTPIVRHDQTFAMVYSQEPPFEILQTRDLSPAQIRELKVFADFWDSIHNSGRFPEIKIRAAESGLTPFDFYFDLAQKLYARFGRTHSIHLEELQRAVGVSDLKIRNSKSHTPSRQVAHLNARANADAQ